ncbi:MAG TPA: hopanoid biosynthesis-associated protein HpnK [Steroidobacteraceae bacterium]|nr:hopanoid biosynthesis-associated protein HpnK [Steroidobacteraceae bacterium]
MSLSSLDRRQACTLQRRKFLIVTADDFGLHTAVNAAVAEAADTGILTAASLMVAAPVAAEAIRLARQLPQLRVGLHLVLTDGWPALAQREIPDLVGQDGRFADQMVLDSFRYVASARMRSQLRAEIRAQFTVFARSGLRLDHVNTHKHFHLHPGILNEILQIGRDFGMSALRVPDEPLWFSGSQGFANYLTAPLLTPWLGLMRRQLRSRGLACNDRVFGMACSGDLNETRLLAILGRLPEGVTEIYLHPAVQTRDPLTPSMQQYRHADELAGLLSPRVRAAVAASNAICGGYADLATPAEA